MSDYPEPRGLGEFDYPQIDDGPEFAPDSVHHRYSIDTDRCICGGVVTYWEPDDNGEYGEGCEVTGTVWPQRCYLCQETIKPRQEKAEMYDPTRPLDKSQIVHPECGLQRGWAVA